MKSPKFMGKEGEIDLATHTHTPYSYGYSSCRAKAVMWIDTISKSKEVWIIAVNSTNC